MIGDFENSGDFVEHIYVGGCADNAFLCGSCFAELVQARSGAPVYCHAAIFKVGEGGGREVFISRDLCEPYAATGGSDKDVFEGCGFGLVLHI